MRILEPNLGVQILGTGRAWPGPDPVRNADLLALDPTHRRRRPEDREALARRLARRLGFDARFLARLPSTPPRDDEETSESLACRAAREAVADRADEIAAFVHGTTTSRRYTGSQAAAILGELGSESPAFELKAGCSTSLVSLQFAFSLLASGYDNALVSCAETLSKVMTAEPSETWYILADGAAAVWLARAERDPHLRIRRCLYGTDGRLADLYTSHGRLPPEAQALAQDAYALRGDGTRLRSAARERYLLMLDRMFPAGRGLERIRWVVPHQISRGLIDEVLETAKLGAEVVWSADAFGNLGGASVLFSLAQAWERGRFRPGDEILLMSVGGGLSFAMQHWVRA